eukprot:1654861-Pleurochrysis_carterae.AAC.2
MYVRRCAGVGVGVSVGVGECVTDGLWLLVCGCCWYVGLMGGCGRACGCGFVHMYACGRVDVGVWMCGFVGVHVWVRRLVPRLQCPCARRFVAVAAGAALEDGGGVGTGGSHWEMRLFRDEYMTGSASVGKRVVSALTLALFADSGWYAVDAARAEPMLWGAGAGCDFVSRPCSQWTQPRYLCHAQGEVGCSYDRRAQAYCELNRYNWIPEGRRYFSDDPLRGGFSPLLDFCPVFRAFSNGDCTDARAVGGMGEERCESCRCFETHAWLATQATGCYRRGAGCLCAVPAGGHARAG